MERRAMWRVGALRHWKREIGALATRALRAAWCRKLMVERGGGVVDGVSR